MPDSNGFGDYTESGQVIPVSFRGRRGSYTHCMFLNDEGPIAGGRELWGFPKKLAQPTLRTEIDTLVGTLDYGPLRVATGTMGYKHREADLAQVKASLATPNFLLKIIPHVDGAPRICEIVEYHHAYYDGTPFPDVLSSSLYLTSPSNAMTFSFNGQPYSIQYPTAGGNITVAGNYFNSATIAVPASTTTATTTGQLEAAYLPVVDAGR